MKTNFLCRNALPRGADIFLKTMMFIVLCITQLTAQDYTYALPLKAGDKVIHENIQNTSLVENRLVNQCFDGKSYVLLQFYQLPDSKMHKKIQDSGIDLTQYVAANTYRATIPEEVDVHALAELNVRAVDELTAVEKIEPLLLLDSLPEYVEVVPCKLDVRLKFNRSATVEQVMTALQNFQVEYLEEKQSYHYFLKIRVLEEELEEIADMPFTIYIYPIEGPRTYLGAGRGTSIRSEYLNFFDDDSLKGKDVIVGVFESGYLAHIDLSNTTNIHYEDCSNPVGDAPHAEQVCGMLGGQGILRPTFQGVAPEVSMLKFAGNAGRAGDTIGITDDRLQTYIGDKVGIEKMVITNQSYTGGNISPDEADAQLLLYPELMQVAASGNTGKIDPGTGGPKYFTIASGSAENAKNLISVGAIDIYNQIVTGANSGSSKGPTLDGRLKPELVAIGAGATSTNSTVQYIQNEDSTTTLNCISNLYSGLSFGTSYAAPQVAGGLALLYEYYRDNPSTIPLISDTHPNPNAGLMKSIACNTADDLGNPGPDYSYGFGRMNLRKAKKALENHWYSAGEFQADGSLSTSIPLLVNDPDMYAIKVMLYWHDPVSDPGLSSTDPMLVNNLDLSVTALLDNGNEDHFPLVLDPANPALPAVEGTNAIKDNLNNIEQVVIKATTDHPIAPVYYLNVSTSGTTGNQRYYLTWELIEPGITITSPYPDEVIANGGTRNSYIEWDYYGDEDNVNNKFRVTITDNNGYEHSSGDISGELRIYKWEKCSHLNINTSDLVVRVERLDSNDAIIYSAENTFDVYNAVNDKNLQLDYFCDNQVCLSWNMECDEDKNDNIPPFNGVSPAYFTIYKYDDAENDMVDILNPTTDYFATVNFDPTKAEEWYAVSATYIDASGNPVETKRCNAIRFTVPSVTACSGTETCSPREAECYDQITILQGNVSGDYNASDYTQTNSTPDASVIINNGERLELSGGSRVRLHPGLSVASGATFRADNEDCQ